MSGVGEGVGYPSLDIPNPLGHTHPGYTHTWKGPGTRDTHPPERIWHQWSPCPRPLEQIDRHLLKNYLPAMSAAGGKYVIIVRKTSRIHPVTTHVPLGSISSRYWSECAEHGLPLTRFRYRLPTHEPRVFRIAMLICKEYLGLLQLYRMVVEVLAKNW